MTIIDNSQRLYGMIFLSSRICLVHLSSVNMGAMFRNPRIIRKNDCHYISPFIFVRFHRILLLSKFFLGKGVTHTTIPTMTIEWVAVQKLDFYKKKHEQMKQALSWKKKSVPVLVGRFAIVFWHLSIVSKPIFYQAACLVHNC